ncbi:MAG: class C sortase [Lachnospiraceae bacterium]
MKKVWKVIFGFVFFIGLCVLFFPVFSNWYNNRVNYSQIESYENELDTLTKEEREEKLAAARAYNDEMASGTSIKDPFSDSDKSLAGIEKLGYQTGSIIGYIEIPKINVKLSILVGTTEDVLKNGAGYMLESSFPVGGEGTHTVITGHRGLPTAEMFRYLNELNKGDRFFINTYGETFAYEVDQIKVVKPFEMDDLAIVPGQDYATLITCEPYGVNSHRMLVRGHRTEYSQEDKIIEAQKNSEDQFMEFLIRYKEYLIAIAIIALVSLLIIVKEIRRARKWRRLQAAKQKEADEQKEHKEQT